VPTSVANLAPLPVPIANLKRIRNPRKSLLATNPAALIPLFYAALLYLAGIAFAHYQYLRPGYLLLSLLPLAIIAVVAILKAPRLRWLPIALIWIALGVLSAETEPEPSPDPAITQLSDGLLRNVEGTVVDAGPLRDRGPEGSEDSEPDTEPNAEPGSRHEHLQRIDLQLTAAEIITPISDGVLPIQTSEAARVRLTVISPSTGPLSSGTAISCGERLRAVVRMLPPDTFRDPGVWSRAAWLESQQITALATVSTLKRDNSIPRLQLLDQSTPKTLPCLLNHWRNAATARLASLPTLTRSLPAPLRATPQDAAMLTALLTGDRTYLTRTLRTGFERTGSFHLIVVSGLHLAILAGCIFTLSRRLRLHRLAATALTLAVTLAYALFTGFAIPAQRSFWMIALYLIGRLFYRTRSPLNVIGFATIVIDAASPRSVFSASLQMTVISVTAIAGIALPLLERTLHARLKATRQLRLIALDAKLPPRIAQFRVTLRLVARHLAAALGPRIAWRFFPFAIRGTLRLGELLFVTLIVELALALPMAIYFHRITVYALPVNLLILPLLAILVPAAMLLLLTLAIWPAAAIVPAAVCTTILHASVFLVRSLGALSLGDLRIPDPARIQIAAAILLFVLAIVFARSAKTRRFSLAALAIMTLAALWPRPIDHPADALLFEAIDVGQGDSLLLLTPSGKSLLIDGGGLGFFGSHTIQSDFDVGEEVVSPTLWSRGIRRLDAVALTHAHHDHMGGLPAILRNFRPRELWIGNNPPTPAYLALLAEAQDLGIRIRAFHAGDQIPFGETQLRVLAPTAQYHPGREPANNDSLVLQARFRASSILLAGDAEAPEEQTILTEPDLSSTILKVGHHGSRTSTGPAFLAAVQPQWAVISCGRRNHFGHPRAEVLIELQVAHIRTLRTDLGGASCLILNGEPDGKSVSAQPLCTGEPLSSQPANR
jgi:competence protein ComEC